MIENTPQNFSSSQTANDVQLNQDQPDVNPIQINTESESHTTTEITEIHTQSQELPEHKLCTPCMEENLISAGIADSFKKCPTCNELFCLHSVSRIDPQYCIHCCNDFRLADTQETFKRETRNDEGKITSVKSFRVRHLGLSGQHWMFYNRAITSLSDLELEAAIEYHYGIRNGMLQERDARRTANAHRNKGKTAGNEETSLLEGTAANPLIQTPDGAVFAMSSTVTRRVRTIKTSNSATTKPKQDTGIPAALQLLLDKGFTEDQILAMVGGKK